MCCEVLTIEMQHTVDGRTTYASISCFYVVYYCVLDKVLKLN